MEGTLKGTSRCVYGAVVTTACVLLTGCAGIHEYQPNRTPSTTYEPAETLRPRPIVPAATEEIEPMNAPSLSVEAPPASSPVEAYGISSPSVSDMALLPSDARPGECYARVFVPPNYKTVEERIVVQEATEKVEIIPAKYDWVEEDVIVEEASERLEVIPAQYDMVEEEVLVTPASTREEQVAAEYEWVEEKVLVKPAHTLWKKGRGLIEQVDNATGEIMCLIEVPAEYKTVRKQVLKKPATVNTVEIPAEHRKIRKRVMVRPPSTRTVRIPAKYETVKVKKMVKPEQRTATDVPAEYDTITKEVLVKEGQIAWHMVLCETNLSRDMVTRIQKALVIEGFDPGPADGILGEITHSAMEEFQTANNLAVGGITFETLDQLGIALP
jgi:hypothetical protein